MKNSKLVIAMAFAVVGLTTSVFAQSAVKATIPFDFTIAKQTLPAGEYKVESLGTVLQVVRLDGPGSVFMQSYVAGYKRDATPKLIFHRYGNRSFLAQAWIADTGRELIASAREIEYARTENQAQVVVFASLLHR